MWIYKGEEFNSVKGLSEKVIGFIYLIIHKPSGKKYIGRKLLWKPAYKQINKKKKKYMVESDWKDYYSSSPLINSMLETESKDNFHREILFFAESKSSLNYAEEKIQYSLGVLESDEWMNSNIRSKMYKKWIDKFTNLKDLNECISNLS